MGAEIKSRLLNWRSHPHAPKNMTFRSVSVVTKPPVSGIVFLPRGKLPKAGTESAVPEHPGGQEGRADL